MNHILTFWQALNKALEEEMERDQNIFVMGEDIGPLGGRAGVTKGLLQKFGNQRIRETPLNEELFVGIAIGAAQAGLRPVVEFAHGTLVTLSAADIFRSGIWEYICGNCFSLPIVLRVKTGDLIGPELCTSVVSMFLNIIGLSIVAPSTPRQAKGVIKFALRQKDPIMILENDRLYSKSGEVPIDDYVLQKGKGEFRKIGEDISIITYSWLTDIAETAAEQLFNEKNIDMEILDLISLKPLDKEKIIQTSRKTKKIIILGDEPTGPNGLFANIYTIIKESIPESKIIFLGTENVPIPFGPLKKYVLPSTEKIVKEAVLLSNY